MKPIIVFLAGLLFLVIGIGFYLKASDLSHLGPITFDPTGVNQNLAVAASSGVKAYIADKLCLIGEIMMGVGAFSWARTPGTDGRSLL